MMERPEQILVIKLGALGDFIQALGPMAAIRAHYKGAEITLLTSAPFQGFAQECGYFDRIWIDERPRLLNFKGWLDVRRALKSGGFDRVYDLQNNDRTGLYFKLLRGVACPEWVGVAKGASHRNALPERVLGHAFDGHVQTLALAGVGGVEIDRLGWMRGDVSGFALEGAYMLLVPGCAPHRPEKRWPADHYGALAGLLSRRGVQPVVIGGEAEREVAAVIGAHCPDILDLVGRTSLSQIASLARGAVGAVGNDTGPMHIIGATGCPSWVLFSEAGNPQKHAPKGEAVHVLQRDVLKDLAPEAVMDSLDAVRGVLKPVVTIH